jgi:hypothetical protein
MTCHVARPGCSGRNRIIPLMRRPNTDSAPNMPVTLPRNQLLIRDVVTSPVHTVTIRCRSTWYVTSVYPPVNTVPVAPYSVITRTHARTVAYLCTAVIAFYNLLILSLNTFVQYKLLLQKLQMTVTRADASWT